MSSELGNIIKLRIFGESHSQAIGMVLDGIPPGTKIDMEKIHTFMKRRAPGRNNISTQRKEADKPVFLSGILNGITTGTPICAIIENTDARSKDYESIRNKPRPSHADYPAFVKYKEAHDIRGGGHFSGRLTAPLCIAGSICMQILESMDIFIGAHIKSIGDVNDKAFDPVAVGEDELNSIKDKDFPCIDDDASQNMIKKIQDVKKEGDSIGGIIECCAVGLPPGLGDPIFDGIENKISRGIFGIPAVKGIEFGSGFEGSSSLGSVNNDPFYYDNGQVKTKTNNSGGILGGLSTGMPVMFNVAMKPTPSIGIEQQTVDLSRQENTTLKIQGRHDPCIVPRAVPCVEAATATVILDLMMRKR